MTRDEHFAMVDFVVAHSLELHICAVVDIGRSWKSDRVNNGRGGWIDYNSSYTGHAHFVTTYAGWGDTTPIANRLKPIAPPPVVKPPLVKDDDMFFMKHPDHLELFAVAFVQHVTTAERDQLRALGVSDRVNDISDATYAMLKKHATT